MVINKNDLFIRVIDPVADMKYGTKYTSDGDTVSYEKPKECWKDETVMQGEITFNNYLSEFYMSLNLWTIADYTQQWNEGLKRLETYNQSCFIVDIDGKNNRYVLEWWILYKVKGHIHIQNHILSCSEYAEKIGNKALTPKTCYDFIPIRKMHDDDGEEIDEWVLGEAGFGGCSKTHEGILIKVVYKDYTDSSSLGRLAIADHCETFEFPIHCCWSFEDYVSQWHQGLERLRDYDSSCLVLCAGHPDCCGRFISWWLLYKIDGIIYAYQQILVEHLYEEAIGNKLFTPENCYDFIPVADCSGDDSPTLCTLRVNYSDLFLSHW
jgi:hypothetical protein